MNVLSQGQGEAELKWGSSGSSISSPASHWACAGSLLWASEAALLVADETAWPVEAVGLYFALKFQASRC